MPIAFTLTATDPLVIGSFQVFDGTRPTVPISADLFSVDLNNDGKNEVVYVAMDHTYSGNFDSHIALENSYLHIFGLTGNKWSDVTGQYVLDNKIFGGTSVCAGDFNGDGKIDLFIAAQSDTNFFPLSDLYLSNANGGFTHSTLGLDSWAHDSVVVDINSDGYEDILLTDYGANQGILFGGPSGLTFKKFGSFTAPYWLGPWGGSGICAADFLGDGTKSILVTDDSSTGYNSTNLYQWAINSSGNLKLTYVSTLPTPLFDTAKWAGYQFSNYQTQLGASHDIRVLPFDFGNDKLMDAIVISRPWFTNGVWPEFTEIQFLMNMGKGVFEDVTKTKLPVFDNKLGASPYNPVFEDFNNDGKVDIFLSGGDYSTYDSTVLLMQQPDSTFSEVGKDVFTSLWNKALTLAKQSVSGYVFTDWGNTMSLVKGIDGATYALLHVNYQDQNAQVHEIVFQSQILFPQSSISQNDVITGGSGNDYLDGGLGLNTAVYLGKLGEYSISLAPLTITDSVAHRDGIDTLNNISRLKFTDTNIALDIGSTQTAGSAYLLYQAAFNRHPDTPGVGYWIAQLDKGANLVTDVAQAFINSPEFISLYGANPSVSNYVNLLYQNVLHRAGETGGVNYWNGQLNNNIFSRAQVLEYFAASPENVAAVAPDIAHGIAYQQWVG